MISGSHQATQSRVATKNKIPVSRQPVIIEEQVEDQNQRGKNVANEPKKAVYLGEHVYSTIRVYIVSFRKGILRQTKLPPTIPQSFMTSFFPKVKQYFVKYSDKFNQAHLPARH